jgi:transposase
VATGIPQLQALIESVPRPRDVVIEEGPLSDWLIRHLGAYANAMTSCDPRRNALIAKESDKDDAIDAEKLGRLYQGGYVRAVHHAETFDRAVFKEVVGLYHDRVRNRVRQANRIMAQLRRHGVMIQESVFAEKTDRADILKQLPAHAVVRGNIKMLWEGYDAAVRQVQRMRRQLSRLAKREPQVKRFTALPGVKWIRASTFLAYVDTPWRFRSKEALWKYLGIGLQRRQSGQGFERLGVPVVLNKQLKNAILGAAKSAVASGDNPFADLYERWLNAGKTPRIARRNVARSLSAVMWGMWKTGSGYRPEWIDQAVGSANSRKSKRAGLA